MRNLKIYKSAIPIVLGASLALTGCNKKMDCQVEGEHAHKYVTESGFETYRNSEYEHLGNLTWTDTTTENTDEINALTNFNLIRIDENEKIIEENTKNDLPYMEYEYKYHYTTPVRIGKVWTHISHTGYRFTTDKTHNNLTGNVRDVTYKYQAYKLVVNDKGKIEKVASELADDLNDIKDKYPYISLDDYKQKVYSEKRKLEKTNIKK